MAKSAKKCNVLFEWPLQMFKHVLFNLKSCLFGKISLPGMDHGQRKTLLNFHRNLPRQLLQRQGQLPGKRPLPKNYQVCAKFIKCQKLSY